MTLPARRVGMLEQGLALLHVLLHPLADAGADTALIRELASHADIRTTTVYTAVSDARLEHAIAERGCSTRAACTAPRRALLTSAQR